MSVFKKLARPFKPYLFRLFLLTLKMRKKKNILILWNRGLGDIALGLYGLNSRIKEIIPDCQITYLTREDLAIGFSFLKNCQYIVDPKMKRGCNYIVSKKILGAFDYCLRKPNPTDWLIDLLSTLTPKLELEDLQLNFTKNKIGIHVQSETGQFYGYEKNWPTEAFLLLIEKLNQKGVRPILFGLKKDSFFQNVDVEDQRGDLDLSSVMKKIINECHTLIAPDSGILSLFYYFAHPNPIHVVSLWSDPKQGILKQNVLSPNPLLKHTPLIEKDLKNLSVEKVLNSL
jgi:ADP-heptose:LPS heptosyltransferase